MQADVADHSGPARFHLCPCHAGSLHLESALLGMGLEFFSEASIPYQEGIFADPQPSAAMAP
jgi:hypothetical protein